MILNWGTHVVCSWEPKVKERKRPTELTTARLKSSSENVDALRRDTISANRGCRHVPGEGGGAGAGAGVGVDLNRGVEGKGISAFIMKRVFEEKDPLNLQSRIRPCS